MARKSRKSNISADPAVSTGQNASTAIYVRLSVENSGKNDDGDSIEHQIEMCIAYIEEHPDLKPYVIFEDNGRKGTNFERPAFDRMMNEMRAGNIRCVVVKDLSRFGRNYIEAGNYLEKIFPFLGVRFISVTDHFDSFREKGSGDTLMIPFKNMINEMYAKDISRKIITSFRARQAKGEFLPGNTSYGYLKSDTEEYALDIDEDVADNIRNIYQWRIEGVSINEICRRLDEMEAVTPSKRKVQLGIWKAEKHDGTRWSTRSVIDILKNPVYTGDLVYGRVPKSLCDNIKMHRAPEEEWRVIPDHHEAIISRADYEKVKESFAARRRLNEEALERSVDVRKNVINLFKGRIYCGDCGKRMRFVKGGIGAKKAHTHYVCGGFLDSRRINCTLHRIDYAPVCDAVMARIRMEAELAADTEELRKRLAGSTGASSVLTRQADIVNGLNLQLNSITKKLEQLYIHRVDGVLDELEYRHMKQKYDEQKETLEHSLKEAVQKLKRTRDTLSGGQAWMNTLLRLADSEELTQELVDCFVQEVRIFESNRIEIIMKHTEDLAEMNRILHLMEEEAG